MSVSLHCPNCGESHGKASEASAEVYCGNCGTTFKNEYADDYRNNSRNSIDRNRTRRIMAQMGFRG